MIGVNHQSWLILSAKTMSLVVALWKRSPKVGPSQAEIAEGGMFEQCYFLG